MINVSSELKEQIQSNRALLSYINIVLKGGTELNLEDNDIWENGIQIDDSVSTFESFDIGAAITNSATITLNNIYDKFTEYDFYDAVISIEVGAKLSDESIEKIRKGIFAVDNPKYNGSIITLECLDNMRKFDRPYSESALVYPATIGNIVQDACTVCGVTFQSVNFPHDDFVVQTRPTDEAITFRDIISWCAQIAGCFCRCDVYGRLEIKWYNQMALENPEENEDDIHKIDAIYTISTSTDDVVITGVRVSEKTDDEDAEDGLVTYQEGTEGYVISIEDNDLITGGSGQTIASWLGEKLIGMRFRKATISHVGNPLIEAGDVAIVEDTNKKYNIIVSSTEFSIDGRQMTESRAETPAKNSATNYSASTKNYVEWRKAIQKEKSAREAAIEDLQNMFAGTSGAYTTVETVEGGGSIFYLHNKPELADSDMIWKMTAEAWGVSTDGGETWTAGMTVDGDTIMRILTAVGVNADWVNAGAITVKDDDGNIIFSVDMDTKSVIISGDSVRIGGKTATQAIDDTLAEAKDYSDDKLADYANTVSNDFAILQAQVDGQVEDWYYDYEPSMQNYPASEWITTEERTKHIGDRFFWKSKGYAYRFMEDNGAWGWVLLQDTDITKAMQTAVAAQDTADGKRRTFVVTPQPPYDIGDLWMTGTDVLTCTVSRTSGSVYVSSDWQKLNTYTDDTVANEALEEAKNARNLNIILDNEYQGIATDYEGNYTNFPAIQTVVQVLYGHTDVSSVCTYNTEKSTGITGSWNAETRTYTVTDLVTDTGWVDITASYLNLFTTTKRFNVAKIKGGVPGEQGTQGINLILNSNFKNKFDKWTNPGGAVLSYGTDDIYGTYLAFKCTDESNWDAHRVYQFSFDGSGNHVTGKTYTLSFYAKADIMTGIRAGNPNMLQTFTVSEEWKKYITTYTANSTGSLTFYVDTVDVVLYLTNIKLEEGAVNNPVWTPAVGDLRGADGTAGRTYFIETSVQAIKRGQDNSVTPEILTANAYYRDGTSATRTAYSGRWKVQTSVDGVTWTDIMTSTADESSKTFTVSSLSSDIVFIRFVLYAAGGTTTALDMQTLPIVVDVDALTHEQIFNLLTNNGAIKGIYQEGDQLYISFTYAKGGELALGGVDNTNGKMAIYNASGVQIGYIDNTGINFESSNDSTVVYKIIGQSALTSMSANGLGVYDINYPTSKIYTIITKDLMSMMKGDSYVTISGLGLITISDGTKNSALGGGTLSLNDGTTSNVFTPSGCSGTFLAGGDVASLRPTDANRATKGTGGIYMFKATYLMTANKPKADGHIIGIEWDNSGGYDSQIAIGNNSSSSYIGFRAMSEGVWGAWQYLQRELYGSNSQNYGYIRIPGLGVQIAWKRWSFTTAISTAWGSLYESSSATTGGNWSAAFSATPATAVSVNETNTSNTDMWINTYSSATATSTGSYYLERATSLTSRTYTISIIAIGPY